MTKRTSTEGKEVVVISTVAAATVGAVASPIIAQIERYKNKKKREVIIPGKVKNTSATELLVINKSEKLIEDDAEKRRVKVSEDDKEFAKSLLSQLVEKGIETSSYTGLLTCNVDISSLAKTTDGAYRGFCLGQDGRILEQAKFREISVPTPMLVFQLASIITGQYYQHILTKRLESMDSKLQEVINILEADDKGRILADYNRLAELWELSSYDVSQKKEISDIRRDMDKGRQKMWNLIKDINPKVKRGLSDKEEAKNWMTFFENSRFGLRMELACCYEKLYFASTLLTIKAYKNEEKEIEIYYNALCNQKDVWRKYSEKYHEIKVILTENIKELSKECWIGKDSIRTYKKNLSSEFKRIEKLYKCTQEELFIPLLIQLEFSKNELIGKYLISNNNI